MVGIVGYMSGGKSYTAVRLMLGYLKAQHRCATNIRLNCRAVTSYLDLPCLIWKQYYYFISDVDLQVPYNWLRVDDYHSWPVGTPRGSSDYEKNKVYIFLDEVSSLFDSMLSAADGGIQAVATWARHSEKRGQMMYLIMQFPSELHKRLRVHITSYIECTNTNSLRIPFLGCGLPFFMRNMIVLRELLPDSEIVLGSAHWHKLDSRVFTCYNTGQIVVGNRDLDFKPVNPKIDMTDQIHGEMIERTMTLLIIVWFFFLVYSYGCMKNGN